MNLTVEKLLWIDWLQSRSLIVRFPAVVFLIPFLLGSVCWRLTQVRWEWWERELRLVPLAILFLLITGIILKPLWRRRLIFINVRFGYMLWMLVVFFTGFMYTDYHWQRSILPSVLYDAEREFLVSGQVTKIAEEEKGTVLTVNLRYITSMDEQIGKSERKTFHLTQSKIEVVRPIMYPVREGYLGLITVGDELILKGAFAVFNPATNPWQFDYQRYQRYRKFVAQMIEPQVYLTRKPFWSFSHWLASGKLWSEGFLRKTLTSDNRPFVMALLTGESDYLPDQELEQIRRLGLSHIIAVSGLHLSLLGLCLKKLLTWVRFPTRWIAGPLIMGTWVFVCFAGCQPSALRVGIYLTILEVGKALGKNLEPVNLLAVTAWLVLIYNPLTLFLLSFQLSFVTYLALLTLYLPVKQVMHKLTQWILGQLSTSLLRPSQSFSQLSSQISKPLATATPSQEAFQTLAQSSSQAASETPAPSPTQLPTQPLKQPLSQPSTQPLTQLPSQPPVQPLSQPSTQSPFKTFYKNLSHLGLSLLNTPFFNWFESSLSMSITSFIGSAPIVLFSFYQLSLSGILMNLWAVPLSELILVLLILTLGVGAIVPPLGVFLSFFLNQLVGLFNQLTRYFDSACPWVWQPGRPPMLLLGIFYLICFLLWWWCQRQTVPRLWLKRERRALKQFCLAVIICTILLFVMSGEHKGLEWVLLDVGQGDGMFLGFPGGFTMLVDGGGQLRGENFVGEKIVKPFLLSRGIGVIDLVCITHCDADHVRGLLPVLEEFRVRAIWMSGDSSTEYANQVREVAKRRNIPIYCPTQGEVFSVGRVRIEVLHPVKDMEYFEENDRSIVLRLTYIDTRILLTGDLGGQEEGRVLQAGFNMQAEFLKVGHHGSKNSSTAVFLTAVNPQVACISVGKNNYGHPAPETLTKLIDANRQVLRTDEIGAMRFIFLLEKDGYHIEKCRIKSGKFRHNNYS